MNVTQIQFSRELSINISRLFASKLISDTNINEEQANHRSRFAIDFFFTYAHDKVLKRMLDLDRGLINSIRKQFYVSSKLAPRGRGKKRGLSYRIVGS